MILPELNQETSQFGNLIQDYGGLLGIDGGSLGSSKDVISPQVYPKIVNSRTFLYQMLDDTIYFTNADSSLTIYHYFEGEEGDFSPGRIGDGGTQNLNAMPASLRQLFTSNNIKLINYEELQIIKILRERINIEFDATTGVMTITSQMPDGIAAAQVNGNAIDLLTNYLKGYRTQKAQNVLEFSEEQYQIGRNRFREAQDQLATFQDENVNLSTATALSRLEYLQAEFDLAYSIYNSVAQKRIQARMNLQRSTPVFNIIQPATVPLQKAHPHWLPIIIFSIALGLVVSFLVIALRIIYTNYKTKY